jgi:hypothetical protein
MTLPAGEQQTLDGISEALRATEPRLASMFSIFGRLFNNEGPPLRERLPVARPFACVTGLRRLGSRGGRQTWQLVFVLANVVAAVTIVAVMIALNAHTSRDCARRPSTLAPVFVFRANCPAQAGPGASTPSK